MRVGSKGVYELKVIRADGSIKHDLRFENLITDIGLEYMATGSGYLNYCRVGSGNAEPDVTDTQLQAQIGSMGPLSATIKFVSTVPPYHCYIRKEFEFPIGGATGNVSEIGIGWGLSGQTLFSRALVRDIMGNPTTITILADERLYVNYIHYYYLPSEDWVGEVTLTGNIGGTYDVTGRAARITTFETNSAAAAQTTQSLGGVTGTGAYVSDQAIGSITSRPNGTSSSGVTVSSSKVAANTVRHSMTVNPNNGNYSTGLRSVNIFMGNSDFQFEFDPPIPKTADDTLTLNFELSWGRYEE